ncbi:hypothetical protein SLEP1_g29948 [Rubroshorea leprosula]|uniref:Phosphoglycerate mutase-like protein n=1 Tax=Rubroshorea leprosula TaxID=152421 RepID=A0AAV5K4N3_9ROSI|nr:hypothetical protein SLEP1_g29948 [Rubroshorea leprosula]
MDNAAGPNLLLPLHRCKTIHLVRHAQGIHNVEGDKNFTALLSPEYADAHLSRLGWQQVDNLRRDVQNCGLTKRIDLIVMTLQTAVGVFGGEGYTDRMDAVSLVVTNARKSSRAAISSLNSPPFIALDLCRERMADVMEPVEDVVARSSKLIICLLKRKENEIAIVRHGGFLVHTLRAFGNDSHPLLKEEMCIPFANCELRSMVIVDRRSASLIVTPHLKSHLGG